MDLENKKIMLDFRKYDKGTFLIGMNFNTNKENIIMNRSTEELCCQRETYLMLYLGKFEVCIGFRNKLKPVTVDI